jgi:ketosteroid isomerase-like protein
VSPEEISVLDANSAFYRAFVRRDLQAMEKLWAVGSPVACLHPGWDILRGRDAVMESWRTLIEGETPAISCAAASAHVAGDVAWVVCRERIQGGPVLAATNVFVREDGAWRLCLHQAGIVAQQSDEPLPGAQA